MGKVGGNFLNKIMALDVGTKRIGVALSDYLHVIAVGNCFIDRTPEADAIEKIKQIARENSVEKIVVGVPINMDGTKGSQAQDCLDFAQKLMPDFDIVFEDERLTSEEAEENLRNRKVDFRKNKGLVDIESALIILQQYLAR